MQNSSSKLIVTFLAIIFLGVFGWAKSSQAAIILINGQWFSTLNCADWAEVYGGGNTMSCDGFQNVGGNTCGGQVSRINSSGNNPSGGGGKGFRLYICPGSYSQTDSLQMYLFSPVPEMWFRWYNRYPLGFSWSNFIAHKWMYDDPGGHWIVSLYNGVDLLNQDAGTWYSAPSSYGWNQIMGGSTGDGQWHYYEVHLKKDTNGSNGIYQAWVDGVLRNNQTSVNYGGRNFSGWAMGVNQATVGTGGFWDLDDLVISTTGYIGPVGGSPPTDTTAPTVPANLSATAISSSQVNLTWTASTDAVGVTGYNIYRGGNQIGTSATNSYSDTGLSPSTQYTYTISAYDAAGNTSVQPSSASATTQAGQAQTTLLFDGFEAQNMNNWDDDWVAGTYSFATTPVYGGSRSLRVSVTQAGNYAYFFGDHPGIGNTPVTDFTGEEYINFQSPFTWDGTGIHLWTLNAFESWSANYGTAAGQTKPHAWAPYYITVGIVNSGELFMYLNRADGLPGAPTGVIWQNYFQNQGATQYITTGAWHKVKYRAKLNTPGSSDGIFQLWLDDSLIISYSNINYRANYTAYGWNHLMMRYDGTNMPSQYIYRDNITLLSGAPGGGDTTPPAAPSGVAIS